MNPRRRVVAAFAAGFVVSVLLHGWLERIGESYEATLDCWRRT